MLRCLMELVTTKFMRIGRVGHLTMTELGGERKRKRIMMMADNVNYMELGVRLIPRRLELFE